MLLSPITQRALALLLGTAIAAVYVLCAVAIFYPRFLPEVASDLLPARVHDATIPLTTPQEASECPPLTETMHVIRGRYDSKWELAQREISDDRRTIRVEFAGMRGAERIVEMEVGEHSATVRARLDACGFEWWGSIHAEGSHVHVHPDRVCLDLSVSQPSEPSNPERWTAQISLR